MINSIQDLFSNPILINPFVYLIINLQLCIFITTFYAVLYYRLYCFAVEVLFNEIALSKIYQINFGAVGGVILKILSSNSAVSQTYFLGNHGRLFTASSWELARRI